MQMMQQNIYLFTHAGWPSNVVRISLTPKFPSIPRLPDSVPPSRLHRLHPCHRTIPPLPSTDRASSLPPNLNSTTFKRSVGLLYGCQVNYSFSHIFSFLCIFHISSLFHNPSLYDFLFDVCESCLCRVFCV